MTGHRPFRDLTKDWGEARRKRVDIKKRELVEEMTLAQLRQSLSITQQEIAGKMNINQPAIAKLENRSDMHVSNLRRLIESMGGELDIRARFPQGEVRIANLGADPAS